MSTWRKCCNFITKQIIGQYPGYGSQECLYVMTINSQDYFVSDFVGWTLNGNDFITELSLFGSVNQYTNELGNKSVFIYYSGTQPTDLIVNVPGFGDTLFTIRKATNFEGASCDLVCYQASFDYGYQWRFIDFFASSAATPYYSPSAYDISDDTNLQYFASSFLGSQISVSSVWDGSQYVVTINNAFNLGGFQLGDGGAVYTNFTALPCEIVPPTPVPLALLDAYGGAGAAYSVRKLSSSYTGAALRVRRSSDNTEQDIGFVGLDLDTTALTSFVGAGNGFVTKWYDQSGNNNHGLQSTAIQQPQIVFSGSIYTINGKPSLKYIAGNTTSLSLTNNITNPNNYSCFSAMGRNSLGEAISSLSCVTTVFPYTSFIATDNNFYIASNTHYASKPYALTGLKLFSSFWNTPNQIIGYVNSVNQSFIPLALNVAGVFQGIGRRSNTNSNGYISEIIFYQSDKSANRIAIDSNIITYFSIV